MTKTKATERPRSIRTAHGFNSEEVNSKCDEQFSGVHEAEARLQEVQRRDGGEQIKSMKVGSALKEFGDEQ